MKKEIHPGIIAAVIVGLVVVLGYFGWKAVTPPQPPAGSYTPGVPPWMEKKNGDAGQNNAPPGANNLGGAPRH